jgi:hypothetical protein
MIHQYTGSVANGSNGSSNGSNGSNSNRGSNGIQHIYMTSNPMFHMQPQQLSTEGNQETLCVLRAARVDHLPILDRGHYVVTGGGGGGGGGGGNNNHVRDQEKQEGRDHIRQLRKARASGFRKLWNKYGKKNVFVGALITGGGIGLTLCGFIPGVALIVVGGIYVLVTIGYCMLASW